jgi:hypothetical protein
LASHLKEENTLTVFDNGVLKIIFGLVTGSARRMEKLAS